MSESSLSPPNQECLWTVIRYVAAKSLRSMGFLARGQRTGEKTVAVNPCIHDGGGSLHSRLHQPRLQRLMHRFRLGPHSVFAVFALWRLFQAVAMRQKLRFSLGCSSSSKRFFCLEKFIALVTTPLTRQRGLKSRLAALYGRQDSDPV